MADTSIWLQNQNSLFEMTSSADWVPVKAWVKDEATGKNRPSNMQAVDAAGLPIWSIRVIGRQDVFGRAEESFIELRVASSSKPTREQLAQIVIAE